MGRSPCCDKEGLKKGPWTPEEDQKLLSYIEEHGHGNWRALPSKAGLQRCGKSCRLRWTNYLRPDIKRGKINLQEEQTIIQLHALLGNRWSAIATHLPKRTDNEIKNYWNTHLKKRLAKLGIDPVTHKPKTNALLSSDRHSKNSATLSHMAQWESARLEAEARLARQSKLRSYSLQTQLSSPEFPPQAKSRCLDVVRAWQHGAPWRKTSSEGSDGAHCSQTSTLSSAGPSSTAVGEESSAANAMIEFMGCNSGSPEQEEGSCSNRLCDHHFSDGVENSLSFTSELHGNNGNDHPVGNFIEGFRELLLSNFLARDLPENGDGGSSNSSGGGQSCEDSKSYWNSILNLVSSSPSSSPLF